VAQPQRLAEQAGRIGEARLMGAIDSLSAAVAAMREGDDPRLSLEVALLKVARPSLDASQEALLRRIEQLEGRVADGGVEKSPPDALTPTGASVEGPPTAASDEQTTKRFTPDSGDDAPEPGPAKAQGDAAEVEVDTTKAQVDAATTTAAVGVAVASNDLKRIVELWPAVVEHVRQSGSEMLSSLFESARPLEVDPERGVLRVGFPESAKFNKKKAEAQSNVERVAEALKAIVGERLRPVYELVEGGDEQPKQDPVSAAMAEEEFIELIKTRFDASEVPVDERESETG
jgi:DNA polymerase III subunit gamma/tau